MSEDAKRAYKIDWQRKRRRRFREENGYSLESSYATGHLRTMVLERDNYRCVRCGMTATEHLARWGRPITMDHIDRDHGHNALGNLQTLCLSCHGAKDLLPQLRVARVPAFKDEIRAGRAKGETFRKIADRLGFSIGAIWKWARRWEDESDAVSGE